MISAKASLRDCSSLPLQHQIQLGFKKRWQIAGHKLSLQLQDHVPDNSQQGNGLPLDNRLSPRTLSSVFLYSPKVVLLAVLELGT